MKSTMSKASDVAAAEAWPVDPRSMRVEVAHDWMSRFEGNGESSDNVAIIRDAMIWRLIKNSRDELAVKFHELGDAEGGEGVLYVRVKKQPGGATAMDVGFFMNDGDGKRVQHPLHDWEEFRRHMDKMPDEVRAKLDEFLRRSKAKKMRREQRRQERVGGEDKFENSKPEHGEGEPSMTSPAQTNVADDAEMLKEVQRNVPFDAAKVLQDEGINVKTRKFHEPNPPEPFGEAKVEDDDLNAKAVQPTGTARISDGADPARTRRCSVGSCPGNMAPSRTLDDQLASYQERMERKVRAHDHRKTWHASSASRRDAMAKETPLHGDRILERKIGALAHQGRAERKVQIRNCPLRERAKVAPRRTSVMEKKAQASRAMSQWQRDVAIQEQQQDGACNAQESRSGCFGSDDDPEEAEGSLEEGSLEEGSLDEESLDAVTLDVVALEESAPSMLFDASCRLSEDEPALSTSSKGKLSICAICVLLIVAIFGVVFGVLVLNNDAEDRYVATERAAPPPEPWRHQAAPCQWVRITVFGDQVQSWALLRSDLGTSYQMWSVSGSHAMCLQDGQYEVEIHVVESGLGKRGYHTVTMLDGRVITGGEETSTHSTFSLPYDTKLPHSGSGFGRGSRPFNFLLQGSAITLALFLT